MELNQGFRNSLKYESEYKLIDDVWDELGQLDPVNSEQFRLVQGARLSENLYQGQYTSYDILLRKQVEQPCVIKVMKDLGEQQQKGLNEFIANYHDNLFFVIPIYKIIFTPRLRDGSQSAIVVMAKGVTLEEYLLQNPNEAADIYPHLVHFVNTCQENGFFHLNIQPSMIAIEPMDSKITDFVDKTIQITLRQYNFRFIDPLNMSYFKKIDDSNYRLESKYLRGKVFDNLHSHSFMALSKGKKAWSSREL